MRTACRGSRAERQPPTASSAGVGVHVLAGNDEVLGNFMVGTYFWKTIYRSKLVLGWDECLVTVPGHQEPIDSLLSMLPKAPLELDSH